MINKFSNIKMIKLFFVSIIPGLGHLIYSKWKKSLAFLSLSFLAYLALVLAILRERFFVKQYLLPNIILFVFIFSIIAISLTDLVPERIHSAERGEYEAQSYWQIVKYRFSKDPKGLLAGGIIFFVIYVALFAPFLTGGDPLDMAFANTLSPPSGAHPLGTDNFGRDILVRIIYGTRIALGIGVLATFINVIFGGFLGLLGGYFRGVVDAVIMRFLEMINSIPFLVMVVLGVSMWVSSVTMLILVLGIFGLWPARIIRSEVISLREEDYIMASRSVGASELRLIFFHLVPNALSSLIVVSTMRIGVNIITVASLSFLGFGVKPPAPSWGAMLQQAQQFVRTAWWLATFPGLCIVITVFAFNLLGDSLRDVLDPKMKQ